MRYRASMRAPSHTGIASGYTELPMPPSRPAVGPITNSDDAGPRGGAPLPPGPRIRYQLRGENRMQEQAL